MKFIAHRINTAAELATVPVEYGVELDLRDGASELILAHDPFIPGELFRDYLKQYRHGTMIVNCKSERIELRALELLREFGIDDFFFLDSSFPMIYLLARQSEFRQALRLSEFETIDTLLVMQGKVDWAWVDCFERFILTAESSRRLRDAGYRTCLVSPELQGRPEDIEQHADQIVANSLHVDAICTKLHNIARWQAALGLDTTE